MTTSIRGTLFAVLLLGTGLAQAQFTVGGDPVDCDFTDLQAAINATSALNQTIHVARDGNYVAQTYMISNRPVVLRGGFADCNATEPDDVRTVLNGIQKVDRVLDISVSSGLFGVTLENLFVTAGSAVGDGGGIRVSGAAILRLRNTLVAGNVADGNGGGIYLDGNPNQQLILDDPLAAINTNEAGGDGGGIYCGPETEVLMRHGILAGNSADRGGAIFASGCHLTVNASGTLQGLIENTALREGSAIHARGGASVLLDGGNRTYSDPDAPIIVAGNQLQPAEDGSFGAGGTIYLHGPATQATLIDTWLAANSAKAHPGIRMASGLSLEMRHSPDGQCGPDGEPAGCSRIWGNFQTQTPNASNSALAVSTFLNATVLIERTIISGNIGSLSSSIFQSSTSTSTTASPTFNVDTVVVADNQVRRLARMQNGALNVSWSTIANNSTDQVFWMDSAAGNSALLNLVSTIVWEPEAEDLLRLENEGKVGVVDCVVIHDPVALLSGMDNPGSATGLTGADPQFAASGNSAWTVTTDSPAFGCQDTFYNGVSDVAGNLRGVGMPPVFTAGAYRAIVDAIFQDRFQ